MTRRRSPSGCPSSPRRSEPSRPAACRLLLARIVGGEAAAIMMSELRGASNTKAKRELGWQPRYPSWREGFARGLG